MQDKLQKPLTERVSFHRGQVLETLDVPFSSQFDLTVFFYF